MARFKVKFSRYICEDCEMIVTGNNEDQVENELAKLDSISDFDSYKVVNREVEEEIIFNVIEVE